EDVARHRAMRLRGLPADVAPNLVHALMSLAGEIEDAGAMRRRDLQPERGEDQRAAFRRQLVEFDHGRVQPLKVDFNAVGYPTRVRCSLSHSLRLHATRKGQVERPPPRTPLDSSALPI